jgi:hypothetical protein
MAQTLTSSTTTLCPVSEFLKRVDRAAVALLASDMPGFPADNLETDGNVLAALLTATGMLESAVMMGGKYSAEDLALLKATTCGAQGLMFGIISDLAWVVLFKRRPNMNAQPPASLKQSMEWLDMLAGGKRIFAFQQATDATIMERVDSEASDIEARNGVVFQAEAYFGRRADRSVNWFGD